MLVSMADLAKLFEKAGCSNVKTLLASGNVIFESALSSSALEKKLEASLKTKYKRDILVMVRGMDDLKKMERQDPFSGVKMTPNTRLYVTFLSEHSKGVKIPEPSPEFRIVRIFNGDVFTAIELSEEEGTTDSMSILEKVFGNHITTRNWNTVQKVFRAATEPV